MKIYAKPNQERLETNIWRAASATAQILKHEVHPEGFDVDRIRFFDAGRLALRADVGHIISIFRGKARLYLAPSTKGNLSNLRAGIHLYLPPGPETARGGVGDGTPARVKHIGLAGSREPTSIVRDEDFLAAWLPALSHSGGSDAPVSEPKDLPAQRSDPSLEIRTSCLLVSHNYVRRCRAFPKMKTEARLQDVLQFQNGVQCLLRCGGNCRYAWRNTPIERRSNMETVVAA